jgi:hypothetical protein
MVEQFITKTRPNLDVPFFEDSWEGKARSDAIIQLALDHPELVISRETMAIPATELVWTGTWTFAGIEEYSTFLQLAYNQDTTLRIDRSRYYMNNGHSMLIEFKTEDMDEPVLQVNIAPTGIISPYQQFSNPDET